MKGQERYNEGCLSFPGVFNFVVRARKVKVKYLNEHGKPQRISWAQGQRALDGGGAP